MKIGLTFDDVLLLPRKSSVLPAEVDLKARLTNKIKLNIPFLSSPMDTVTEASLAIAIAREGGIGIIHRNLNVDEQVEQVKQVKKSESWVVYDPITISPDDTLEKPKNIMDAKGFSCFPVISGGKLVGILTYRDLRFKTDFSEKVSDVMTKDLITTESTDINNAVKILDKNKIEKLPVVDKQGRLKALITVKDIEKAKMFPSSSKDKKGRLLVGAAVGPFDMERVNALIKADVDVIVVDTAHGHSRNVINATKNIKKDFDIDVVSGNIVTSEAAEDLISAGADAIKVGLGPSAICTTRVIAGVGVPQITAIQDCVKVGNRNKIPIIADGGIKYSGDIAKAIVAGASTVMMGSMFAGTDESPGQTVFVGGRKYKKYRGMGSISAMERGSAYRYGQAAVKKLVPEGIEGIIPYRGTVAEFVYQLVGGLRAAMGYCGCKNIAELRKKAEFMKITPSGLKESHPHDIQITEESPNYWRE